MKECHETARIFDGLLDPDHWGIAGGGEFGNRVFCCTEFFVGFADGEDED